MKKAFALLAIIFFLIGTTTVFAVTNSHIGKEIQGEASLFLNDVEFVNKAIIVEGISFVPVREVSEKLGLNVEFEDGEIFLTGGESLNQGDIQVLTDLMGIAKREMDDASKAIQFHEDEIEKIKQLEEGFFELNQVSGEEYSIEFHEGRINAELAKFEEAESRYNEHKKLLESSK